MAGRTAKLPTLCFQLLPKAWSDQLGWPPRGLICSKLAITMRWHMVPHSLLVRQSVRILTIMSPGCYSSRCRRPQRALRNQTLRASCCGAHVGQGFVTTYAQVSVFERRALLRPGRAVGAGCRGTSCFVSARARCRASGCWSFGRRLFGQLHHGGRCHEWGHKVPRERSRCGWWLRRSRQRQPPAPIAGREGRPRSRRSKVCARPSKGLQQDGCLVTRACEPIIALCGRVPSIRRLLLCCHRGWRASSDIDSGNCRSIANDNGVVRSSC
mmetsp:Transcript_308/g.853  ORF Transcript_308/g.853 Transcript_308/m.853 type:complete len:269 (+) Transcript_308:964-1770(+)